MMKTMLWTLAIVLSVAITAQAQPTTDGSLVGDEAFYGTALSVQNTRTQFGDANNPDSILAGGGSEIDQVFATVSGGRLHVLVTGNLEDNFNKLQFFIDSGAGGVNTIDGSALPSALDPFCCGGLVPPQGGNTAGDGALQRMDGLTFDAGFTANYALIVTHGGETLNSGAVDELQFYASSAHFADLTQGTSGPAGGLGMQLAPRGLPNVLRGPGDYNNDGILDAADYTVYRDSLGNIVANGTGADGDASGTIDAPDYSAWADNFGRDTTLSGDAFKPGGNPGNTEALIAAALPGLSQGQLIDRAYAQGAGGCTDDTGAGCLAAELEFALDVDPAELGTNESSHRDFDNFVDLRLAIDNSNTAGVLGNGATATNPLDEFAIVPGEDTPESVVTGVEFSIPLSQIGNPTGDIKLLAFINGGGHDFISNQLSGEGNLGNPDFGIPRGNLGNSLFSDGPDPALITLVDVPGDQFVTISQGAATSVPEPASLLMAVVAAIGVGYARRR